MPTHPYLLGLGLIKSYGDICVRAKLLEDAWCVCVCVCVGQRGKEQGTMQVRYVGLTQVLFSNQAPTFQWCVVECRL